MEHKILILNNSSDNHIVLNTLDVLKHDYSIFLFSGNENLKSLLSKNKYDLFIINSDEIDNNIYTAINYFNSLKKNIPILIISNISNFESFKNILNNDFIDFVKKPINEFELKNRIKNALNFHKNISLLQIEKQKNKKYKNELKKLSLIADETRNSFVIFDVNGKIEWANKGFFKTYGYTIDEY